MSSENFCDPLDKNQPAIRLISQFPVLFSFLGSLFIILIYTCYKETRNFAYKLILQISIADFIYCFAHFFGESASVYIPISSGWLCSIQAYLVNFGMEASFMWSMVVAWTLYSTVVRGRLDIQKKFWIYAVYGYLIPLVASAVPFITGNYGPVGYRCWITINNNRVAGEILRFALLYVPLWIVIIFNTVAYYKVIKFLKVYVSGGPDKRFVRRLRAYPLILVICWLGATVRSIYILFACDTDYNFLDIISIVLPDLNGFFNALAYGLNHHVQAVLVKKCPCMLIFRRCCWCCSCCYWATQSQKVAPIAGHERLVDSEMSGIELSIYSE